MLFDRFSRGRYSTDASHYQIEPLGVVVPKTDDDVRAAMAIAREEGVPLLPRGGGTSQSGQTVGRALVMDFSKHLKSWSSVDAAARTCIVEPGIVLDELNRQLGRPGLWFPVDVSTVQPRHHRRHGRQQLLRHALDPLRHHARQRASPSTRILADGTEARFGEVGHNLAPGSPPPPAERVARSAGWGESHAAGRGTPTPNPSPQAGRGTGGASGERRRPRPVPRPARPRPARGGAHRARLP